MTRRVNRAQFLGVGALALTAAACSGSSGGGEAAASSVAVIPAAQIEPNLRVASWPRYTDPANVRAFSKANGVRVIESSYTSNEQLLEQLTSGRMPHDVIVPDADHVNIEKGLGLLSELDHSLIPNLKHLDPHWTTLSYDPGNRYSVIKDTGITTFARRSDRVPDDLQQWDQFFDFLSHSSGLNVNFVDSAAEVIGVALIALGHSINSDDPDDLEDARQLLLQVRPYVSTINGEYLREFQDGNIDLGIAYSGDALRIQAARAAFGDIEIAVPDTSEIWIDSWAIAASAPDPHAAHAWINYMLTPAVNAREMEHNAYEVGTPASFPLVKPASLAKDPLVVFGDDILSNYQVLRTTPTGLQQRETIWAEFRAA